MEEGRGAEPVRDEDRGHGDEAHREEEGARIGKAAGGPEDGDREQERKRCDHRDDVEVRRWRADDDIERGAPFEQDGGGERGREQQGAGDYRQR